MRKIITTATSVSRTRVKDSVERLSTQPCLVDDPLDITENADDEARETNAFEDLLERVRKRDAYRGRYTRGTATSVELESSNVERSSTQPSRVDDPLDITENPDDEACATNAFEDLLERVRKRQYEA
ncbi:unnamed protein product [Pieris macdunnoughi]|uniref:Uncharacterized protein n=1 Tax=Pieris macdunnoughi TaxID=345717 RepID=A0A821XWD3_9NEOP|nr:unnamed protein product [Pieris macdunnoughi]